MNENWYIILELEFDPNPVNDEAVIADRIEEKRKFWSSKANDFNHGAEYRKYSQMLPDIKKDMIGEANIRAELIKDAYDRVYGPIDKVLEMIKKTEITQDIIGKVANKFKVDIDIVKRRAELMNIKISEGNDARYRDIYDKYYNIKPKNSDQYNAMNTFLGSFNVSNLYEFLYAGTSIKNPQNLPCDALKLRAKEKKTKEFFRPNAFNGNGRKLCICCEECFSDDESKRLYDNFLYYYQIKRCLEDSKSCYQILDAFTYSIIDEFVVRLTMLLKDRKEAEEVFMAFCKVEKLDKILFCNYKEK